MHRALLLSVDNLSLPEARKSVTGGPTVAQTKAVLQEGCYSDCPVSGKGIEQVRIVDTRKCSTNKCDAMPMTNFQSVLMPEQ